MKTQRKPGSHLSRRPAGMLQRAYVYVWLAEHEPLGDTAEERNESRRLYVRLRLQEKGATGIEMEAVLNDIESYPGWESG